MISAFPTSDFEIVGQDGVSKGKVKGVYSSNMIMVQDAKANLTTGDELRRTIPNGTEEAFEVVDPVFYSGMSGLAPHFQVKIKRKGAFQPGTGGNYTINVSGNNSRVNLHSVDQSTNTVNDHRIFADLRSAIEAQVSDNGTRQTLLSAVDDMAHSANDKPTLQNAYQKFIASAANHMTVIAPFLPALSQMLIG